MYDVDGAERGVQENEESEERGLRNAEKAQEDTCVFAEESYSLPQEALPEIAVERKSTLEESITEDQENTVSHVSSVQFLLH